MPSSILYLVIDDMGSSQLSYEVLNIVRERSLRLTLSVLPYAEHKEEILKMCHELPNVETMLHAPMQALNPAATSHNMILEGDHEITIRDKLSDYLKRVPAKYANNHQGSRVSRNEKTCSLILQHLASQAVDFLDSRTVVDSCFLQAAERLGIAILSRNLFLKESYEENLRSLEKAFIKEKKVVAIGHPRTILKTLQLLPANDRWQMRPVGDFFRQSRL